MSCVSSVDAASVRLGALLRSNVTDRQAPWFAIWTRSRHEQLVSRELRARGIPVFLPTFSQVSAWKDRRKRIDWPLFPGYCFAQFLMPSLHVVRRCEGVVAVLSNGSRPVPVPDAEIEALQSLVASGLPFSPCPVLPIGAMARVVRGPLSGVVGRVERHGGNQQLVLAVNLLNSGARVQIVASDLEAI